MIKYTGKDGNILYKILYKILKILMILLGVLAGEIVIYLVLRVIRYDAPIYLFLGLIMMVSLAIAQLLCLMFLFFIFARLVKFHFLLSVFDNFTISFFFTILYHVCGLVTDHISGGLKDVFDSAWVMFLALPTLIFIFIMAVFVTLQSVFREQKGKIA